MSPRNGRLPPYLPEHQFCCSACREVHQLRCVGIDLAAPMPMRMVAAALLDNLHAIQGGRYGGVRLNQLFD